MTLQHLVRPSQHWIFQFWPFCMEVSMLSNEKARYIHGSVRLLSFSEATNNVDHVVLSREQMK